MPVLAFARLAYPELVKGLHLLEVRQGFDRISPNGFIHD